MKAIVLLCNPGARFHFGKYAADSDTALNDSDEIMHSDTLFSAIVNTYSEIYGDANELIVSFESGHITISSLNYCLKQGGEFIWFLPKPVNFNLFEIQDSIRDNKSFKGINYISKKVWENMQNPASLSDEDILILDKKFAVYANEIILPENGNKEDFIKEFFLSKIITLPKVLVRDNPERKTIYQLSVTEIADNSAIVNDLKVHYYFMLDIAEGISADMDKRISNTIQMLAYMGIGAERSTIGKIESIEEINNWKISIADADADKVCSVSLFSPQSTEMDKLLYYKTFLRGGRRLERSEDENKKFLKSVRMIQEGAIVDKSVKGNLADISPTDNKTFLRNGKALCLPVFKQWISNE